MQKKILTKKVKEMLLLKEINMYLNFMGVTKIYDGKKIYTIVPEDEEIIISKVDER